MITRRTKVQLVIFALITVLGCAYVGARYAHLDRVFVDSDYEVVAHLPDSGGIFAGAEVTYRGVTVGKVDELELTEDGVDAHLAIEKKWDEIPAETKAIVGNRSAVGEQYVEIQPSRTGSPYLEEGSEIDDTEIPLLTSELLNSISTTVDSVNKDALRSVVSELGTAFSGVGDDLGQIIDTSTSFIETANDNFELTRDLIRDGNKVLGTQLDQQSAIRTFSRNLRLFTDTVVGSDKDLRKVIDSGSATANELKSFLEENEVDLAELINNLVTTGEIVVQHLDGIEQLLVVYPYVVEGGFTVVSKDPVTGKYDAHFGMVLTQHALCRGGYEGTDRRPPQDTGNRDMKVNTRCTEPASKSNARGAQHAPRPAPAGYRAPVAGFYDPATGDFTWADDATVRDRQGNVLSPGEGSSRPGSDRTQRRVTPVAGEEAWSWLMLQPVTQNAR